MRLEGRERPYRELWSRDLRDRLALAETEHLSCLSFSRLDATTCHFLVEETVDAFYDVYIQRIPACTCHDFIIRQDLCKHILYINRFIIGLDSTDPRCFQQAHTTSEIRAMLQLVSSPIMFLL
jgi:hypothetical protein